MHNHFNNSVSSLQSSKYRDCWKKLPKQHEWRMQKSPFSGGENSISYLIFSEFNIHIFNIAVWKCVKQYATYHPRKETYYPRLTTNCNHRKEKEIQVFINICLFMSYSNVICGLCWSSSTHLCSATVIRKQVKLCIFYSILWLQEIFNSCTNVKKCIFLECVQLPSSQSNAHIKLIRFLFCIQKENKISTLHKILTVQLAIIFMKPDATINTSFYWVNVWHNSYQKGQWCYLSEVYNLCNQRVFCITLQFFVHKQLKRVNNPLTSDVMSP
jgi:hypothetical protein